LGQVIEQTGLSGYSHAKIKTLSKGYRQRVGIAASIIHDPEFIILDEPTTGLHFEDIRVLMEMLNRLVDKGNTVLIIEHNLDVIKQVDYVIDIGPEGGKMGGQLVGSGTPEDLIKVKESHTGVYLSKEFEHQAVL